MKMYAVLEGDMQIRNLYISPFLVRDYSCAGDGFFAFWRREEGGIDGG